MSPKRPRFTKQRRSPAEPPSPAVARAGRNVLHSSIVGALPIVDDFLRRVGLDEFLRAALPPEDGRTKLSPVKALLVLLRNLLVSREPISGVGEWAARHARNLLGLRVEEIGRLNDDCVGRALDRLFLADVPSLILAVGKTWSRSSVFAWTNCTTIRRRFPSAVRTPAPPWSSDSWAVPPWPSPSATTRTIVPT